MKNAFKLFFCSAFSLIIFSIISVVTFAECFILNESALETTVIDESQINSSPIEEEIITIPNAHECRHSLIYDFNNETKEITKIYSGNRIEMLIFDIECYGDTAKVYKDGDEVISGILEEGMKVHIFHNNFLYGVYEINNILEPVTSSIQNSSDPVGFLMPIDMNINGVYICAEFGSNFGGPNYGYATHRGLDIAASTGTEIRAIKSGTIEYFEDEYTTTTWGKYVKINHGNGFYSLYAHMSNVSSEIEQYGNVSQGDVIGYVGTTGYTTDGNGNPFPHLHIEIQSYGTLLNPMNYLANAPSYSDVFSGFVTENGNTYYYENGVKATGWRQIPDYNSIYYFNSNGVMQTGWMTSSDGTTAYYFQPNGKLSTGLTEINGQKYFFRDTGEANGTRGQLLTGWRVIDDHSRYFIPGGSFDGTAGRMATGLTAIGNKKYYFNADGSMLKGWAVIDWYTHYFNLGEVSPADDPTSTAGQMVTGWAEDLAVSTTNIGTYYFGSDGRLTKKWATIDGYTYYFTDGEVSPAVDPTSRAGQMITGWAEDLPVSSTNIGTYYFGSDGKMKKSFQTIDGELYYFIDGVISPAVDVTSKVGQLDEYHTVSFESSRGNLSNIENPIYIPDGAVIGTLPTLTNYNWTFLGWKNSAGQTVGEDYTVNGDMTLTAVWQIEADACNIKCYSEGVIIYDITPNQGINIDIIIPPAREGYTFTGWYDSNGQKVGTYVSDLVMIRVPNQSEYILTAGWEATN